jgi:hypothetical protein
MIVYKKIAGEYAYPTIQSVVKGCVFIIKKQVDNPEYTSYRIQYRVNGILKTGTILHTILEEYLKEGKCTVELKQNFKSGTQFIRVPIIYLTNEL